MKKKSRPQNKNSLPPDKISSRKHVPVSLKYHDIIKSKWVLPLLSLGLLILFFTIRKIANYDTGFHLAAGRWILTNFSFPVPDTFTYTVNQNDYLDIQWLYQVILYIFYSMFSYAGLTVFNSIVIISVFYLLLKRMNLYGVPVFLSLLCLLLCIVSIQLRFSYRPEIITWLFMLLTLLVLDRYYYFNKNSLFFLPVIMLLWVNMHGLFILGLLIIAAYLVSIFIDKKILDKNLLKWSLISIAAVFINPYFSEGALFPFYLFTRLQKGNIFQQNITELQSPWTMSGLIGFELYLYYSIAILSFVLIFITYKKRSFHEFALLAAFFYISFSSFRNVPVFIIYAVYIIGVCISDMLKNKNPEKHHDKFIRYEKTLSVIFTGIFLLICVRIITGAYYLSYNSEIKFGTGIDETVLPEQSAEFLDSNSLDGRIINKLEFGGWLDWRIKQPVFIDGRLEVIKEDFYKEYLSGFSKNGLRNLTNKFNTSLIINDIANYNWTSQIREMFDWRLIHWDETAAVYANYRYAENIDFDFNSGLINAGVDTSEFSPSVKDEIISSGRIRNFTDWMSGFISKQVKPVSLLKMGNFAFDNQRYKSAEILYLNFILKSAGCLDEINYADVYANLGSAYYVQNDLPRALTCFEKSLAARPDNPDIRSKMVEVKKKLNTK